MKRRPSIRHGRPGSRTFAGIRAARARSARKNLDKLRTMRLRRASYAQVECGKRGHSPLSAWRDTEMMCEACEKDISHLYTNECMWKQDDPFEGGPWMTSCGNAFEITEGTPHSNDMKFCPYCGLYLVEAPSSD